MKILFNISNLSLAQIIVFGCLSMGGYYFFMYNDGSQLRQSISDAEGKSQQIDTGIKKKETELKNLKDFKKEVSLKEKSVNYFLNFIPNQLSSIDVFSLLNREAKDTGINIEDKKDQPSLREESYEILRIKLKVSGAFPQVVLFLSRLTNQKRVLIVNNVSISVADNKKSILADLDIFAFRYHEKKEKEKEKDGQKKDKEQDV